MMLGGVRYELKNIDGFILLGALLEHMGEKIFYPICGWETMESFREFSIKCDKFISQNTVPKVYTDAFETSQNQ